MNKKEKCSRIDKISVLPWRNDDEKNDIYLAYFGTFM